MLTKQEREQLITEAMKVYGDAIEYLQTFSDSDLMQVATWNELWSSVIDNMDGEEYNRIKYVNDYVLTNRKPAHLKSGDIYLINNGMLELCEKDYVSGVIFTDYFRDWLEYNSIEL